jgi:DNA-binding transcriptional ArsR family regulator
MKCSTKKLPPLKPSDFRKGADIFKALANPSRLMIVNALGEGERCVADLTALVGLDTSTVSKHLTVLRHAGILVDDRRGTQVFYALRTPCVLSILCCLNDFHSELAAGV